MSWGEELAGVEGLELRPDTALAPLTTLGVGGPAELLIEVASEEGFVELVKRTRAAGRAFQLIGLGSNLLVPDEGLAGVVARLGGRFRAVDIAGTTVRAGAAVSLPGLARRTARAGLTGLEALAGFPSTVGGAVFMNAGCYGTEIRDVLRCARILETDGSVGEVATADLDCGYRSTRLQRSGGFVLAATFDLAAGDGGAALARIEELNRRRWQSLPADHPNAGSIFKNPPGDYAGRLIELCGLKGRRVGGALVSPKHANVIVNAGDATAADVLALMLEARRRVAERFAIVLEPEIVLTGGLRRAWEAEAAGAGGGSAQPVEQSTARGSATD